MGVAAIASGRVQPGLRLGGGTFASGRDKVNSGGQVLGLAPIQASAVEKENRVPVLEPVRNKSVLTM